MALSSPSALKDKPLPQQPVRTNTLAQHQSVAESEESLSSSNPVPLSTTHNPDVFAIDSNEDHVQDVVSDCSHNVVAMINSELTTGSQVPISRSAVVISQTSAGYVHDRIKSFIPDKLIQRLQ